MSPDTGSLHLGHHGWLRLLVAVALVLIFILTLEASPAAGASAKACRVTDNKTGQTYGRLQQAVKAAKPGPRLVVKGTCHGGTVIIGLMVRDGRAKRVGFGAGISDRGYLRLCDVVVRDNRTVRRDAPAVGADLGGGTYDVRSLRVVGKTRVTANRSTLGGGVYSASSGSLLMKDASSVNCDTRHHRCNSPDDCNFE